MTTARQLVRLRVRHFHAGLVLGSRRFVEGVFEANRGRFGARRKNGARPIRALGGECYRAPSPPLRALAGAKEFAFGGRPLNQPSGRTGLPVVAS